MQLDSRHQARHQTYGAGAIHIGSRQQPGSSGNAATSISNLPLIIYKWGSHYRSTPSRGQEGKQEAWEALEHETVSNTTRQELCEDLTKSKMKPSQDPDEFLCNTETARDRRHDTEEHFSPERLDYMTLY